MVFAFIIAGINLACTSTALAKMGNGSAKNVIVMISDGCGFNHIDAASYYQYGKAGGQVYEHFPTACSMSTYYLGGGYDPYLAWNNFDYVKSGATDSAAAATAMSTGVKTKKGAIGVDENGGTLTHILERAEEVGKSTGVVTSVQLSEATPAGFVAHNPNRSDFAGIANEMINDSAIDVIMGCGNPDFYVAPASAPPGPPPDPYQYVGDIGTWNALKAGTAGGDANGDGIVDDDDHWNLIQTQSDFQSLATGPAPDRVIGVVAQVYNTLQQDRSGDDKAAPYVVPLTPDVPTLEEMTKAALNVLDNNTNGFFLMVEGGAIDLASHAGQSGRVIEEEIDFNHSVEAVIDWVQKNSNWGETLLIVTGDHETGYLLGPGSDPTWQPLVNNDKDMLPGMEWYNWLAPFSPPPGFPPMPPMDPRTDHTNSLVPFFAKGDVARFFKDSADEYDPVRGRYFDNTEIANVIFNKIWEE